MPERVAVATPVAQELPSDSARVRGVLESLTSVRVLATSRTTETAIVLLPGHGEVVRKRRVWPSSRDRVRGLLRTTLLARSPAEREFRGLGRLASLPGGPFAPRPLAFAEERGPSGVLRSCVLLEELVEDTVDLATWLTTESDVGVRRRLLTLLAVRAADMHRAGLFHRDLHPRNVLVVRGGSDVRTVDCPALRVRAAPLSTRRSAFDLACLDVGLTRLGRGHERARMIAAYCLRRAEAATGSEDARSMGAEDPRALCARIEAWRLRIDARESRRLPR